MLQIGAKEHVAVDSRANVNGIIIVTSDNSIQQNIIILLSPYVQTDNLEVFMMLWTHNRNKSICLESVYPHSPLHTLCLYDSILTISSNSFPWCGLSVLQLNDCGINNEMVCALFQKLSATLKILDLSCNRNIGTALDMLPCLR